MNSMKFQIRSVVMPLIAVNVVAFIVQYIVPGFTESFLLASSDIISRPWILFTHMFLHSVDGPFHLLFNMYVLLIFGPMLEQRIGTKRFLMIYFLSGIIAAFGASFFYAYSLGASGAIMGMLGVLIILMPDLKLLFFFVIPLELWKAAIVIALLDVFGIFYSTGIGNIAHLVGMAVGLLYGLHLKKQSKQFQKKFGEKKHLNEFDAEEYLRTGRI